MDQPIKVVVQAHGGKLSAYWLLDPCEWWDGPDEREDNGQAFIEVVELLNKHFWEKAEVRGLD